MVQWEDDLRAVVEHRGAGLLAHARGLVEPSTGEDLALDLTVDALVAAFRRRARVTTGEHGSVRIVTDDDLDALEAAVRREQDRLASVRPDTGARRADRPAPLPDGGPSDDLTVRLPEVVAQVRVARRRRRRHALVAGVAGVVVVAVAASAVTGWPWDRGVPDPAPTSTAYAGACGTTLPTGPSLLPVTLADDESTDRTVLADQTWHADYAGDASTLTSDDLATLGTMTPEVVLARGGKVVGLGVSTGEVVYGNGDARTAPWWPGVSGTGSGGDPTDLSAFADYDDGAQVPATVAVRFVPCGGGRMPAGDYRAYLYGTTDDGSTHVLSHDAPVTVLPDTPSGYQPPWLEGSALACGETVDEFFIRITAYPFIDLDAEGVVIHDDGLTYPLKNSADTAQTILLPRRAAIAWIQDGKIVGVGRDERAAEPSTVKPGQKLALSARPWDTHDYCAPSTDGEAPRLAAGTYQVLGYARVPSDDPEDPDAWFVEGSGPEAVVVHSDGSLTTK